MQAVTGPLAIGLPDYLPVLGHGMFAPLPELPVRSIGVRGASRLDLSALLAKVLLAFTLEFERESKVSLALCANCLRVLDDVGMRVRDLPRLTGVSKEAMTMALSFLKRHHYLQVERDVNNPRTKVALLTPGGRKARETYLRVTDEIEQGWQTRFGNDPARTLREALERLVGDPAAGRSPLFEGLEPYPEGWRASVPRAATLPHYPMVLHRGGFPDGS